ncbi:uncharacterized protein BXZ73DRAFT_77692 [Epithele typhae]|uniref:uncharacterized protein n=1 Tax=Epithele typhae TaxID=378194 RepID=UPI0020073D63|nr:uncharacterized protein BXZ73DRAFT_77692 [Epithele typhae]KAH9931668.1 hypothetical protein BXZ73DRAFT_77692 [Epithele typhae]
MAGEGAADEGPSGATCRRASAGSERGPGGGGSGRTSVAGTDMKGKGRVGRAGKKHPTRAGTPTSSSPAAAHAHVLEEEGMASHPEGASPIDRRANGTEDKDDASGAGCVPQSFDAGSALPTTPRSPRAAPTAVHDGEYYMDSADCVVRVGDTLFRVHRYFLGATRPRSSTCSPCPRRHTAALVEGSSDDNPIWLYGESRSAFGPYSPSSTLLCPDSPLREVQLTGFPPRSPLQLQAYNTPAGDVDRLLTIAEMTNKYHFASIEKWAVDALYNVISGLHGAPQEQYALATCTSAWMKRLLEVAMLCDHPRLRDLVAESWMVRIIALDLRPVHALDVADHSGLRHLRLRVLRPAPRDGRRLRPRRRRRRPRLLPRALRLAPSSPDPGETDGPRPAAPTRATLSRTQRQRLLSGHWSLSRLWARLRAAPPRFDRPDGCTYHQQGCVRTWALVWAEVARTEATLRRPAVDVLARLQAIEEQLLVHADLACALTPACKRAAFAALREVVLGVRVGLADHFVDLTAEDEPGGEGREEEGVATGFGINGERNHKSQAIRDVGRRQNPVLANFTQVGAYVAEVLSDSLGVLCLRVRRTTDHGAVGAHEKAHQSLLGKCPPGKGHT